MSARPNSALVVSLLVLLLVCLVASCVTSPTGRRQLKLFPEEELDAMGLQTFAQLKAEQPASKDAATNRYVRCVTDALLAQLEPGRRDGWEVVVFEEPSANAFALPGRRIGVHTGLLKVAVDQHQLAAVVGHEIGHVLAGHSNERMSQQFVGQIGMATVAAMTDTSTETGKLTMAAFGLGAQFGVLLPYSRAHESEADLMGLDLMAKAGFDPAQSVELWRNMGRTGGPQPPEFMSTHPSHATRISDLQARLDSARALQQEARAAGRKPACKR